MRSRETGLTIGLLFGFTLATVASAGSPPPIAAGVQPPSVTSVGKAGREWADQVPTVVELYVPSRAAPASAPVRVGSSDALVRVDSGAPVSSASAGDRLIDSPRRTDMAALVAVTEPDHPVLTEIYQEPPGLGGPVGRDPADPHLEFIELYLPTLASLAPGLSADALNLTLYDVEGDASSPGLSLVNYRIDLPTFDLDPSNGLTGLPRPASGVVVLGWVDYVGNPPTDLAGTPATRVALIDGGVTSTTDFTFIAINGSEFSGTTNFPVPVAISYLEPSSNPVLGVIEQGSSAYLLVNRDDIGYLEYCGINDPGSCNSFPNLAGGTGLGVSSLLDGLAPNDDSNFVVLQQPYTAPTGDNIDLEFVLPSGGAFSLLVPQLPEQANGYRRLFTDVLKTTEDGIPGNEDPALDAVRAYGVVSNVGPFRPTPGYAPSTTSGAVLSVADALLQNFQVLTGTAARPGLVAANAGGDFGIVTQTTPASSSNPAEMAFSPVISSFDPIGQVHIAPAVEVQTFATTTPGHVETVSIQVDASPALLSDPPVGSPTALVDATFTAISPTTGLDALGLPFQATAFVAIQGLPDEPGVANEVLSTSFAQLLSSSLGTTVFDATGNGSSLIDPATDLSDPVVIDPMLSELPTDPLLFINPIGTTGDLLTLISNSAEVQTGASTYNGSIVNSRVQARAFAIPETPTSGSNFVPTDRIHYTDPKGLAGDPNSGLTDVLTERDFEIVLVDSNLRQSGTLETGATDDFGLVVQVGSTRPGASVVPGQLIFLSLTGGLEGADVDSLDVPPHGNLASLIYVDLDPLDTVLGAESIDSVIVIDGSGNGEIDIIEVIAVPEPQQGLALLAGSLLLAVLRARRKKRGSCYST